MCQRAQIASQQFEQLKLIHLRKRMRNESPSFDQQAAIGLQGVGMGETILDQ